MPRRDDWQSRIKRIERQYQAVRLAVSRLLAEGKRDPTILINNVQYGHIKETDADLEGTYIVRLFAEFETGLRLYWETIRDTHPRTIDLLNSLAGQCVIPDEARDNAHLVREYRNGLVHEREDEDLEPIPIAVARGYLCRYFSFLPPQW